MSANTATSAAYIVAALLFILSLAGLSRHETAKAGNGFGIAGMTIALLATVVAATDFIPASGTALLLVAMVIGAAVGVALFVLIFTLTLIQRLLFGRPDTY